MEVQKVVLGGGCFWCLEAVFEQYPGVLDVVSGYAGGATDHPKYNQVSGGRTGHAEVVEITFDPKVIQLEKILDVFWKSHDPTTMNRQGADEGTQYRSIFLYANEEQKKVFESSRTVTQKLYTQPIVTQVHPLKVFYPAEDYHQDYYRKNPSAGYCQIVIAPKLKKLGLNLRFSP